EVLVDESLDPGSEEVDQPGNEEEARTAAHDARHDEDGDRDPEYPRGEGEHLVRNRRESGDEDRPEVVAVVEDTHALECLGRESGDVLEEEIADQRPEPGANQVPGEPTRHRGNRADERE